MIQNFDFSIILILIEFIPIVYNIIIIEYLRLNLIKNLFFT